MALSVRNIFFFVLAGLLAVVSAASPPSQHTAPARANPSSSASPSVSDRASAVTFAGGVRSTVTGASQVNPLINDLASVQDLASMQPDLSQLNRILEDLGMTFYLEQSRDMTMFMPIDSAFKALPFNIHELGWQAKWRIIQYHILPQVVLNLDDELEAVDKKSYDTWEGSSVEVSVLTPVTPKPAPEDDSGIIDQSHSQSSPAPSPPTKVDRQYIVNNESLVVSHPPRIETFNGASYKVSKVLLPPDLTPEDLSPAKDSDRVNPEIKQRRPSQNLRSTPYQYPAPHDPNLEYVPTTAKPSSDGSIPVDMKRSSSDPKLPGSIRPDPLADRSSQTPEFIRGINDTHARWDNRVYKRTPNNNADDVTKPHDEIMGFYEVPDHGSGSTLRIQGVDDTHRTTFNSNRIGDSSIGAPIGSSDIPHIDDVLIGGPATKKINDIKKPSEPLTHSSIPMVTYAEDGSPPTITMPDTEPNRPPQLRRPPPAINQYNNITPKPPISSHGFNPVVAPRIQGLGLTDGLLPVEAIIADQWSNPSNIPPPPPSYTRVSDRISSQSITENDINNTPAALRFKQSIENDHINLNSRRRDVSGVSRPPLSVLHSTINTNVPNTV